MVLPYALAIMSYQLLTGQLPFKGMPEQIMFQHLTVAPKPPSELNSRLSPAVDAVILRALAKNSEERFPTIKAFALALQQALDYTDLRAQLMISREEALQGASRTITLFGKNQTTVTIPLGAQDGQVLRLPDQGTPYYNGGSRGPLLLTLSVNQNIRAEAPALVSDDLAKPSSPVTDSNVLQQNRILQKSGMMPRPSGAMPSKQRTVVVLALVLLVIASIVLATVFVNGKIATNNANASATAQSINNTNATGTAQAQATNDAATAQANSTATAIAANPDPYQPAGTLAFVDSLSQPNKGQGDSFANGGQCQFAHGAYQVSQAEIDTFFVCQERATYSNFAFEAKMTIDQGDCGGMTIRSRGNGEQYLFSVCSNGFYSFIKRASNSRGGGTVLKTTNSSAIKQGIGQLNVIAIVANGSRFDLYVNHQKIDSISDGTYSQGYINLIAYDEIIPTTVTYRDARVWIIR
jgi:hypothetical protein